MRHLRALGLLSLVSLAACRTPGAEGESGLKITNGQETSGYSAVVRLDAAATGGICSGTFVDDETVLTAAHCIQAWHDGDRTYPRVGGWVPDAIYYSPTYFQFQSGNAILPGGDRYDIAVIKYGAGAAAANGVEAFPKVASTFPGINTPVTLVGYGHTSLNDQSSNPEARKYTGTNTILTAGNGTITLTGPCAASNTTQVSVTAPGDSGGPLLFGDYTIVGVVSNGGCSGGQAFSNYTAVTHDFAKQILQQGSVATVGSGGGGGGGDGQKLCGKPTANTTVCIDANRTVVTVRNNSEATYDVQSANPSASLPGATSYAGVANLSFISGFSPQTQVAFVVNASTAQGRLMYVAGNGWALWPGSGTFAVAPGN